MAIIINVFLSINLCAASDTLHLHDDDFIVIKDDYIQLFLQIKVPNILDQIKNTPNITICFEIENKKYIAQGTYWYESATPSGCNCTFLKSICCDLAILCNDTLSLIKTPPDRKKWAAWKQVHQKYKPAVYFQYEKRYQDHIFYFYPDGTFVEYQRYRNYQDVPCEKGWIISWGNYEKRPQYYILNSDTAIDLLVQDTAYLEDVKSYHIPQDSLFINIISPYTQLLSIEDTCKVCDYKHQHIFSFDFNIECANDKLNKEYETEFNSNNMADTTGMVRVFKPQDIQIESVFVKIYWNPNNKDTTIIQTIPYRYFKYKLKKSTDNFITIHINSLNYSFLTRTVYINHKLRRKGRKSLVLHEQIFKKP